MSVQDGSALVFTLLRLFAGFLPFGGRQGGGLLYCNGSFACGIREGKGRERRGEDADVVHHVP